MRRIRGKFVVVLSVFILLSALDSWAQEKDLRQKVDRLEQRIEELEQKQAEAREELGALSDVAGHVSIGGVLAGVHQYEWVDGPPGLDDQGRGAVAFQPEVSITPTDADEIFFCLGFGAGNGLAGVTSFTLSPWAADVEGDVKGINGRDRDYLLQAWYKHTFTFSEDHTLGLTGGIIDATGYLDENAYANDEYTQFMNEALVNGPTSFLPSYDIGGALEWEMGKLAVKGVVMQVGENDEGRAYNFYGVQVGCTLDTALGEGNYRVIVDATSDDFSDPGGRNRERLKGAAISFDQELGDIIGAWIRCGWSDDDALIDFKSLYSGGIDISGKLWGREQDNIGIGYAYLDGAGQTIASLEKSQVAEAYVRLGLNDNVAITFDLQYMKDSYKTSTNDVDGWIAGVRTTCEF